MKSIKLTIAVTIILLAVLYYLNNDSSATTKVKRPINQVSLQSSSHSKNTQKSIKKDESPKIAKEIDEFITEDTTGKNTKKKTDPNLDYVTAYRDWQYFENCYTDIEDFRNEKDPLQTLAERFAINPRESQTEPTAQQNMYYQQHVDICKTLIQDAGDEQEQDDYYQILSKLQSRFQNITPKTQEAKQLAHAIDLVKQLKKFQRGYENATYPVSTLSTERKRVITDRIQSLTESVLDIYGGNDTLNEQDTQQINLLSDEIDLLRKELMKNRSVDTKQMAQGRQILDGHLNSIDDYMHKIQSSDAFIILSSELYNPGYYQQDSTVMQRMKAQTGIKDSYYIRILNRIVTPLVACSMNYPCDAQSDYMMSYCLGLRDSMFNQACGTTLEDFYFNFYIGYNQMNDVNNYFNYLVNRYAN